MKKIFVFILCIIFILGSVFIVGCDGCQNNSSDSLLNDFNKTEYNLVENGTSNYKIVIPKVANSYETVAAEEVQSFIQQSTKTLLPIITDENVSDGGYYISIGNTSLLKARTEIVIDKNELKDSGIVIRTIGQNVYLVGATEYGTLYSAYKFLEHHIGFKAYAYDCVVFDYKKDLNLLDINYSYSPSIQYSCSNDYEACGTGRQTVINNARMFRPSNTVDGGGTLDGKLMTMFCHTIDLIVEKPSLGAEHPDWFSSHDVSSCQPCFSNPEMIEYFSKKLIETRIANSTEKFIMLGMNDNPNSCNCPRCIEQAEKYGGQGGIFARFVNKVCEYVEGYFEENNINRELTIVGLMYYAYDDAPVIENSDGTFTPVDPSVVLDSEGLVRGGVCFTPIDTCFTHYIGDPNCPSCKAYYKDLLGWASITDTLWLYTYSNNFASPTTHFNNWSNWAKQYKLYEDLGVQYEFNESNRSSYNSMSTMRVFVRASLAWDADQDVYELIKEFIEHYYGIASPYMLDYFNALMEHFEYVYVKSGIYCHKYNTGTHVNSDCYPLQSLKNLENKLVTGINVIKSSSLSEEEKEIYIERVYREFALNKVEQYRLNKTFMTNEKLEEIEKIVFDAVERYGIEI